MGSKFPKYMMATVATFQGEDVSKDNPSPCFVFGKEGDDYIGEWIPNAGRSYLKFPSGTTRECVDHERKYAIDLLQISEACG
jgi:hypothetical protein